MHQIAIQEQHKAFIQVRKHMKKAKKRQAKYHDKFAKVIEYHVNDPVYYKNNKRKGKLDIKWRPFYRILDQTGPAAYIIKNQLDGSTSKVHAELLRLANIDEWVIPKQAEGRQYRKDHYVVPPESESNTESDSEEDIPLSKLINKYRREREKSDSEDDIPLMELSKRLKSRDQTIEAEVVPKTQYRTDSDIESVITNAGKSISSDEEMDANEVTIKSKIDPPEAKPKSNKDDMKTLLRLISDML